MPKPHDHTPCKKLYSNNYLQVGGGDYPVFAGATTQRGYGLGSLFSGLLKSAMPLVKRGAVALGKTAVRTGLGVLDDAIQGKNIKAAAKQRIKGAGNELVHKAISHIIQPTQSKNNKRKRKGSRVLTRQKTKKRKGSKKNGQDIFG